ncbi:hypothetical protein [Clostridium sp.]|uniref:hypothetical protein n=1 Tax=Clostridium sp. TaxID=1506 RepID=UPI00321690F2
MKYEWQNYGDINFIGYGGCLVRKTEHEDCFEVMSLTTEICDYDGEYEKPMIVARCYIDLSCWEDSFKKVNYNVGYDKNYTPKTEEQKMSYCVDLINYYGIQEFDPDFPEETGCGCYALGSLPQWIIGKAIAQKFMRNYEVPEEFII